MLIAHFASSRIFSLFNPYFKLESMFMKIAILKKGSALEAENLTDDAYRLELTFI